MKYVATKLENEVVLEYYRKVYDETLSCWILVPDSLSDEFLAQYRNHDLDREEIEKARIELVVGASGSVKGFVYIANGAKINVESMKAELERMIEFIAG